MGAGSANILKTVFGSARTSEGEYSQVRGARYLIPIWTIIALASTAGGMAAKRTQATSTKPLAAITIDYPAEGSIFPPEISPPTFLWRDSMESTAYWMIEVTFPDGFTPVRVRSQGEGLRVGEIDPRCVSPTKELPTLSPQLAAAHTWILDSETWEVIKKHSVEGAATITITGTRAADPDTPVSCGVVTIVTSRDPVGAPIFYRDVPLMPSESQKGVVKPLAQSAIPLIGWRLRDISKTRSRLLLEGMHTCANCHSFSTDGKTLGMDLDGPQNDKGLYAIVPITPRTTIRTADVISWNSFPDKPAAIRVGFMSQLSPDGRYVLTTVNGAAREVQSNYYVVNFRDYHFLQVFYPTRGILAWYDRTTGERNPLPGADDEHYVQTDGVWSADGKSIVFARAKAKEPYVDGQRLAERANDPEEAQIRYDLYRMVFNGGKGGRPELINGASRNGMSNTFPKVSPDGRWIVYVQCRNGQLMRPDGQLFIVPAEGGKARRMRCNTALMNSWHSFSPNGQWMVFSSKSRSPYTQMFLTHLDALGNDSPAILIENSTAANRAVNIPEFVNIPPDGLVKIDAPAAEYYQRFDEAMELSDKGRDGAAIEVWKRALALNSGDARAYNNLGALLLRQGKTDEAIEKLEKAVEMEPGYGAACNNLGVALLENRRYAAAVVNFEKALSVNPSYPGIHNNLGRALAANGKLEKAIEHWRKAIEIDRNFAPAHANLGDAFYGRGNSFKALEEWRRALEAEPDNLRSLEHAARLLATSRVDAIRNGAEAVRFAEHAVKLSGLEDAEVLGILAAAYAEAGRFPEAVETSRRALSIVKKQGKAGEASDIEARIVLYESRTPYRDK
jgi:tetratricopeptide (TPR) repeat protein